LLEDIGIAMRNTRFHLFDEALDFALAELRKYKMFFKCFLDFTVICGTDGALLIELNIVTILVVLIIDD